MQVMDAENGRLRLRAFSRTKKRRQFVNSAHARHMTSQEALEELAHAEWKATMKELFKEAAPVFKIQRERYTVHLKEVEAEQRRAAQLIVQQEYVIFIL